MKTVIDSHEISINCPHCRKETKQSIGRLKTNPKIRCAGCGQDIHVKADQFRRAADSAQKQLDALGKAFGKLK